MPRFLSLHLLENRFPALHGARVLAIVSVLQAHVSNLLLFRFGVPDNPGFQLSRQVWFGMDLFFILSGFLIGSMLFHSGAERSLSGIGRFYARRSLRIFPAYYVMLTLLALMPFTTPLQRSGLFFEYTYTVNYLFVTPDTVLPGNWSLCVEEHFYLAVPLLLALLRLAKSDGLRLFVLLALWASGGALRAHDYFAHKGLWSPADAFIYLYARTHDRYDILMAGVALAFVYSRHRDRLEAALSETGVRVALGLVFWACLALLMLPVPPIADGGLWLVLSWGTITSVMYGALVPLLIAGDGPVKRALSARFFVPLATLGYGVYLVHVPLCHHLILPVTASLGVALGLPLFVTWSLSLALLLALSLAGSYLLHVAVERPALLLRDKMFPSGTTGR